MEINISSIFNIRQKVDGKLYLVGGSLRDILLNNLVNDWDFVVERDAFTFSKKIAEKFRGTLVELDKDNAVYRVVFSDGIQLDFCQMKGNSIEEDLKHRDFTINGMAYDMDCGWPVDEERIIDPFGGRGDVENKIIKHIEKDIFVADPIRLLRVVRLMSELHFNIHPSTLELIKINAGSINLVAGERITAELFKILKVKNSYFYLNYMDETLGLLYKLFPELEKMKEVGECKYHVVDCWTHSIYTVKVAENFIYDTNYFEDHIKKAYESHTGEIIAGNRTRLELIKLGALFHDVGKPSARKIDETGRTRFRGHEITGAEIIREYAEKLKLSIRERDILYKYVELHMLPLNSYKNNDVSGQALYDIFSKMGEETLDILLIALSDIIATRKLLVPDEEMGMFKVHIEYIANNYLTRYRPIESINHIITGKDIMENLNIPTGIIVGNLLEEIKKAIYLGKISPTKEAALKYVEDIF